jgi:hypothetical protein
MRAMDDGRVRVRAQSQVSHSIGRCQGPLRQGLPSACGEAIQVGGIQWVFFAISVLKDYDSQAFYQ